MASYEVARRLGISGLGLSRLTSTLLVETSEGHKTNVGLSLKFESKGLKVLGYSRKLQRGWEFSDTAVKLMQEYKVRLWPCFPAVLSLIRLHLSHQAAFPDVFKSLDLQDNGILKARKFFPHSETPDQDVKSIKKWLESKGVNSFEPVALFAEQLEKVSPSSRAFPFPDGCLTLLVALASFFAGYRPGAGASRRPTRRAT